MHPNSAFRPADPALAAAVVREIGFASLFAATPDGPRVAHVPVLLSEDGARLSFHLARGNGLTRHLDGAAALAVVTGPDAYISPADMGDDGQVPTWNYVAVEMEGRASRLDRAALIAQIDALTALNEARVGADPPWTRAKLSGADFGRLVDSIAGFELAISGWRTTVKLSQNKPAAMRAGVAAALAGRGHGALAHLMQHLTPAKDQR